MKIVFVGGVTCPSCKALKPFIEDLANQNNIQYEYIEGQESNMSERVFIQNNDVTELPTVIIYDDNGDVIMHEGFHLPGFFSDFISLHLEQHEHTAVNGISQPTVGEAGQEESA